MSECLLISTQTEPRKLDWTNAKNDISLPYTCNSSGLIYGWSNWVGTNRKNLYINNITVCSNYGNASISTHIAVEKGDVVSGNFSASFIPYL